MYELSHGESAELESVFNHHAPAGNQSERFAVVRGACKAAAKCILSVAPRSTIETHKALEALQEAMFWANAAIAREKPTEAQQQPLDPAKIPPPPAAPADPSPSQAPTEPNGGPK